MSSPDQDHRPSQPERNERSPEFRARLRLLGLECEIGVHAADLCVLASPGSGVRLPSAPGRTDAPPRISTPQNPPAEGIARWEDEGGTGG